MLDTGIARPPSPTYSAITPATRAPERNAPATTTDLPAEETVRPSTEAGVGSRAAENDRDGKSLFDSALSNLDRRNIVDPESKSVVYVATNTDTGEVVRQVPNETLLKLRAYADTLERHGNASQAGQLERTV